MKKLKMQSAKTASSWYKTCHFDPALRDRPDRLQCWSWRQDLGACIPCKGRWQNDDGYVGRASFAIDAGHVTS